VSKASTGHTKRGVGLDDLYSFRLAVQRTAL
jgi:hypothetical protein